MKQVEREAALDEVIQSAQFLRRLSAAAAYPVLVTLLDDLLASARSEQAEVRLQEMMTSLKKVRWSPE